MKKTVISVLLSLSVVGCGESGYVAKAGGESISKERFEQYLQVKGVKYSKLSEQAPVLKNFAQSVALEKAVEAEGVVDMAMVDASVDDYRRNLLISQYFDQFVAERVTDDAVKNYFANHAADYEEEAAHIAHILVRTNTSMTPDELQQAKTRIYEVYSKLQSGEQFSELAATFSDDKISGKKGGDLGWIKHGAIAPVFSKTAFSLSSGKYSEPFQTEFGYHIVMAEDDVKTLKKSFDDVKGEIRHMLKANAKQAELDRLLASSKVEVNQEALK